jgi:hypothetical protein
MTPSLSTSGRHAPLRATIADVPAPLPAAERDADPAVEEVARALRGARARTGMSEQQVVAVLAEHGFRITVTRLRGWERTGVIRVDAASRLADVYGITIDSLAGRRAYRGRRAGA